MTRFLELFLQKLATQIQETNNLFSTFFEMQFFWSEANFLLVFISYSFYQGSNTTFNAPLLEQSIKPTFMYKNQNLFSFFGDEPKSSSFFHLKKVAIISKRKKGPPKYINISTVGTKRSASSSYNHPWQGILRSWNTKKDRTKYIRCKYP